MAERDPYKILGVTRTASDEEIKRAYRKLALKHHPDRNQNSKTSESRFKEITEAYEILSDKNKRDHYDAFGHARPEDAFRNFGHGAGRAGFRAGSGGTGFRFDFGNFSSQGGQAGFEDIFSEFFGSSRRRSPGHRGASRGSDLQQQVTIDFSQAYKGVTVVATILDRKINVHIPPGVDTGAKIRASGQGAPGLRGGPPGDLYLEVTVLNDPVFRREGSDIHLTLPVTIGEAVLGSRLEIPGPEGRLALRIPPGTQSGTLFRFRKLGFPSLRHGERGDFYVTVQIVVPERVDEQSRELLKEFETRNPMNPRADLGRKKS